MVIQPGKEGLCMFNGGGMAIGESWGEPERQKRAVCAVGANQCGRPMRIGEHAGRMRSIGRATKKLHPVCKIDMVAFSPDHAASCL